MVVSKIVYFHPENGGKITNLTNIFQLGWFNHQPVMADVSDAKTTDES